jgi:hypothetical protein
MARPQYLNFDLLIEPEGERYRARVVAAPGLSSPVTTSFNRPFSDLELENFFLRVGRPRQGVRRMDSPEMEAARQFGTRLFEAVFGGEVYAAYRHGLAQATEQGQGLRVRLRVTAPGLSDLPWEYLYNSRQDQFLSLSVGTPVVRYLEVERPVAPLRLSPPLKVLAMVASPTDYPPLDVAQEWEKLRAALRPLEERGRIKLETITTATLEELQRCLRRGEYHIFHFIGHGGFDAQNRDGLLVFEDESQRGRPLSARYLATLLQDHRSLRLAVLNACEGARTSAQDVFAGAAHSLVKQALPAVIAMQFEITDLAAITFASEFYTALADGYPADAALAEARKSIFVKGNDIEWGTPVLFTCVPDGRVFELLPATAPNLPRVQLPEPPAAAATPAAAGGIPAAPPAQTLPYPQALQPDAAQAAPPAAVSGPAPGQPGGGVLLPPAQAQPGAGAQAVDNRPGPMFAPPVSAPAAAHATAPPPKAAPVSLGAALGKVPAWAGAWGVGWLAIGLVSAIALVLPGNSNPAGVLVPLPLGGLGAGFLGGLLAGLVTVLVLRAQAPVMSGRLIWRTARDFGLTGGISMALVALALWLFSRLYQMPESSDFGAALGNIFGLVFLLSLLLVLLSIAALLGTVLLSAWLATRRLRRAGASISGWQTAGILAGWLVGGIAGLAGCVGLVALLDALYKALGG